MPRVRIRLGRDRYEVLVGQCVSNVAIFGGVLSRIDPDEAVEPGPLVSQPVRLAHRRRPPLRHRAAVDHQRRPAFGVPVWDENVVAEVRSYDQLSPVVGLIALISAADAWRTAALEAPHDVATPHPEDGSICAFDVVQRNAHEVCHHLWDVRRSDGRHGHAATWLRGRPDASNRSWIAPCTSDSPICVCNPMSIERPDRRCGESRDTLAVERVLHESQRTNNSRYASQLRGSDLVTKGRQLTTGSSENLGGGDSLPQSRE